MKAKEYFNKETPPIVLGPYGVDCITVENCISLMEDFAEQKNGELNEKYRKALVLLTKLDEAKKQEAIEFNAFINVNYQTIYNEWKETNNPIGFSDFAYNKFKKDDGSTKT